VVFFLDNVRLQGRLLHGVGNSGDLFIFHLQHLLCIETEYGGGLQQH
jgi:hypothetical protein